MRRTFELKYLLPLALAFLCLHAIAMTLFRAHATVVTYPFLLLLPLLALLACWLRARNTAPRERLSWVFFCVGLLLWNGGMLLSAWEELIQNVPGNIAFYSDFVFFLYGVPVLLAISSPAEDQRIPLFLWLDAIQALLTAYLAYITLFAVIPFTTTIIHPISATREVQVYNAENLILAIAATLRLLAQPKRGGERHFFQVLCAFLWIYCGSVAIYNYYSAITEQHGLFDLFADLPFLFLTIAACLSSAQIEEPSEPIRKGPFALFIANAIPIFYTLALLALGITIVRPHFHVGVAAILVALAVYGIRTTTLQGRYLQSQQALQEARDRLEQVSLKDSLTNTANRRCFDNILNLEWNRATRAQHPLSLLLIDVDYFKHLNDKYGHRYGDQCLIGIANALLAVLPRSGDLLARYGGEEFAAILPATSSEGAELIAARMLQAVLNLKIPNETSIGPFTSISIGIAVYEFPQAGSPATLVEASDRALYKAKLNGRNRIEHSTMQAVLDTSATP